MKSLLKIVKNRFNLLALLMLASLSVQAGEIFIAKGTAGFTVTKKGKAVGYGKAVEKAIMAALATVPSPKYIQVSEWIVSGSKYQAPLGGIFGHVPQGIIEYSASFVDPTDPTPRTVTVELESGKVFSKEDAAANADALKPVIRERARYYCNSEVNTMESWKDEVLEVQSGGYQARVTGQFICSTV